MAKIIFNVFFGIIKTIINIVLAPVNAIIANLFPGLGSIITAFNSSLTLSIGSGIAWFTHLLPPMTKSLILLYLSILIGYYTILYSVHAILKIFEIIKKIKFW